MGTALNRSNVKSPRSTINKIEDLIVYVFQITNNDSQFPKAYRYTLVTNLRNTCIELYVDTFMACSKKLRCSNDAKSLFVMLQQCYTTLTELNALLCISAKIVSIKKPEHLFKLYTDAEESLVKWVKYTKRSIGRMVEAERNMQLQNNPKRDNDGFIILKRKAS